MPSGGYRPGAGRKPNTRKPPVCGEPPVRPRPKRAKPQKAKIQIVRADRRMIIERAVAAGMTPLQYMLKILRDENVEESRRDQMAVAAAPYVHPRLAAIEHSGETKTVHVIKDTPPTADEWAKKHNADVEPIPDTRH